MHQLLQLLAIGLLLSASPVSTLYHTSSEILHWFSHSAAKHPSVLRFKELHERHSRTLLPVATITQDGQTPIPSKPVVMFVFGEHAREVITSEVAVWLTRLLVDNTSSIYDWPELYEALQRAQYNSTTNSSSSSSSSTSSSIDWPTTIRTTVSDVVQKLVVEVIPIVALDSRRHVEEGRLCVRKTSTNVDLNRNWPFAWRREDPSDEQYGGSSPLSEPQSRLMKQLIDNADGRLLGYVNVHSGEWALYTPWDSKPAYAPDLPSDMQQLVSAIGYLCQCKAGPAGAVSGYLAFGSSMDYVYVNKRVPYPLTVEVYGGGNIGKLQEGESNKPLTAFPTVAKEPSSTAVPAADIAATSPPLRHLHHARSLQQQQQQQPQQQMSESITAEQQQQWQTQPQLQKPQHRHAACSPKSSAAHVAGVSSTGRQLQFSRKDATAYSRQLQQQAAADAAGSNELDSSSAVDQQLPPTVQTDSILEVVAAATADRTNCFDAFNPREEVVYRRVVADWVAAFLLMLSHMAESEAYKALAAANVSGSDGANLIG